TARPAQLLLCHLPHTEPGRAHPRRDSRARARHHERDADLPLGMERYGHHQPPLPDLQQPDPRGSAGTAIRRGSRSRILPVLCQQRPADLGPGSPTMSTAMMVTRNIVLAAVLLVSGAMPALAASEADFKTALASAEAAEKQADQLRNKWTTT